MSDKRCEKPGCNNSIRPSHRLCGRHWRDVPKLIQGRVYTARKRYEASRGSTLALQHLRDKQQEAVDAVCGREIAETVSA